MEGEEDGAGFFGGELAVDYGVHDLIERANDVLGGAEVEEVGAATEGGGAARLAVREGPALAIVEVAEVASAERGRAAA